VLGLPVGAPGEVGLVVGLLLGLLRLELLLAAPQPLAARPRVGQIGRQLVAARVAEPLVIFGVGVGRLLENPLDLLTDRAIALGRLPGGVGGDQAAIDSDEPDRHHSGARAEHKHVGEQVRQRRLCATASIARGLSHVEGRQQRPAAKRRTPPQDQRAQTDGLVGSVAHESLDVGAAW